MSGAASPLYDVYQAQWRFSATTLTAIFGVYVLAFLVTLLVFGSVSDYLGRRRVILAGLAMAAGACVLFLAADGVGLLFAARALHGAAVGTAVSKAKVKAPKGQKTAVARARITLAAVVRKISMG